MELESHRGSFTKHSVFCWQSLQLDATSNILAVTFLLMKDVSRREKPLISVRTTQVKCALKVMTSPSTEAPLMLPSASTPTHYIFIVKVDPWSPLDKQKRSHQGHQRQQSNCNIVCASLHGRALTFPSQVCHRN